jgi:predicted enzyme related to lactoylglutathione lyase
MTPPRAKPVVHLELHTGDLAGAGAFYAALCGWRSRWVEVGSSSYCTLELGGAPGCGIVECETPHPLWLPYVEVDSVPESTDRARELGATVLLDPREGPHGWRSVVSAPGAGELALWQPKRER